jgi:sugar phosphate isomerase/epimerase
MKKIDSGDIHVGFSLNKIGWCPPGNPGPFLDFLASAGVASVELPLTAAGEFDRKLADAALARALTVTFHLSWKRNTIWKWYRRSRKGVFPRRLWAVLEEVAERQGTPTLVVLHPFDDGRDRERGLAITSLLCHRLAAEMEARRSRVLWALENMPYDPRVPSLPGVSFAELGVLVDDVVTLGICWDIGHWYLTREAGLFENGLFADRLADRVVHIHVHDWSPELGDHLPPGRGTVPFTEVFETLWRTDYGGRFVLELDHERSQRFGPPQRVIREAVLAIRKAWTRGT